MWGGGADTAAADDQIWQQGGGQTENQRGGEGECHDVGTEEQIQERIGEDGSGEETGDQDRSLLFTG